MNRFAHILYQTLTLTRDKYSDQILFPSVVPPSTNRCTFISVVKVGTIEFFCYNLKLKSTIVNLVNCKITFRFRLRQISYDKITEIKFDKLFL